MALSRRFKRRLIVLLSLGALSIVSVVVFKSVRVYQQHRLVAEARVKGLEAYDEGDLAKTLENLSFYFQHNKDDLDVNLAFADARARMPLANAQHLIEARGLYDRFALQILPADAPTQQRNDILKRLLDLNAQLGIGDQVEVTANQLLALNPDDIDALSAKSEVLFIDGRFSEAVPLAEQLIRLEPDTLRWRRFALEVRRANGAQHEDLIDLCRKWAEDYQRDGRFHLLLARLYFAVNRMDDVHAELDEVMHLGVNDMEVLEFAVELLDLMARRDDALQLIESEKHDDTDLSWVYEVSVKRLWRSNLIDKALDEIADAENTLGELSHTLRRLKTLCLISKGHHEKALLAVEPLLDSSSDAKVGDEDRAWALALRSAIESSGKTWSETVEPIHRAIALSPRDPVLHFFLGDVLARIGDFTQAASSYRMAYTLDPFWMVAGHAYADALLRTGRIEQSLAVSTGVIQRAGSANLDSLLIYARAWLSSQDRTTRSNTRELNELLTTLERAYETYPTTPEITELLAEAYCRASKQRDAVALIKKTLSREPDQEILVPLIHVSRRYQLGMEQSLLEAARKFEQPSIALAFSEAAMLAANGQADDGLLIIDVAIQLASLDETTQRKVECERVKYLIDVAHADAHSELTALIGTYPDDPYVQQYVLGTETVWNDPQLMARAVTNVERILGASSSLVRLAETGFLLRHHAHDEALLAKAIVQVNTVLEEMPAGSESLAAFLLGAEAAMMGKHPNQERAIELLEHAANTFSSDPAPLMRLVTLLQEAGEFDRANGYLKRLAAFRPESSRYRSAELQLLYMQGDFESAMSRAANLVDDSSSMADQLILALMYRQNGKLRDAEDIYSRLLESTSHHPWVVSQTADFYAATGRFDKGLELIKSLDLSGQGLNSKIAIATFLHRHGRIDDARQSFEQALQEDSVSVETKYQYARFLLLHEHYQAAHDAALEALKFEPDHTGLAMIVAQAQLALPHSDKKQAITALRKLQSGHDDIVAMLTLLERVPTHEGKASPTLANLVDAQTLIKEHGDFLPAWRMAISLHVDANQMAEAIFIARRCARRFPALAQPAQWAAELLIRERRFSEAVVEAEKWRRLELGDPFHADIALASIYVELNQPQRAYEILSAHADRIEKSATTHRQAFTLYVRTLARRNDFNRAAELMKPLLSDNQNWRQVWMAIALEIDPTLGERALKMFDDITVDQSDLVNLAGAWTALGTQTNNSSFLAKATEYALRAESIPELAPIALVIRASVAEHLGEYSLAETLNRNAVELNPNLPVALNNLAYVLSLHGNQSDEALSHIEKAIHLAPNQPDFLDTYATVLLNLSRHKEAEANVREALAARPEDPGFNLTLCEVQIAQSRYADAARTLQRAQRFMNTLPYVDQRLRTRYDTVSTRLEQSQASAQPELSDSRGTDL